MSEYNQLQVQTKRGRCGSIFSGMCCEKVPTFKRTIFLAMVIIVSVLYNHWQNCSYEHLKSTVRSWIQYGQSGFADELIYTDHDDNEFPLSNISLTKDFIVSQTTNTSNVAIPKLNTSLKVSAAATSENSPTFDSSGSITKDQEQGSLDTLIEKTKTPTASRNQFADFLQTHAFIHIPKTGGKTIEWLSSMLHVPIGLVYGKKHRISGMINSKFRIKGFFHRDACSWGHVPPIWLHHYLSESEATRQYFEGKTTFCFIRSPFDRAVSEFKYHRKGYAPSLKCNSATLNKFLQSKLKDYDANFDPRNNNTEETKIFIQDDCHYIPQSFYLQSCDIKIRTHDIDEWLHDSFNISLGKHQNANKCSLTVAGLNDVTLSLLHTVYQNDFQYF
mmetsp:Transcript_17911/g.21926  ORF Transcript_17911/g.21926 Transcript_17911/m.21926 type:complete len:388 (+) Transcript_17911:224-1387(+)